MTTTWLEAVQLLYTERHLHATRVAPDVIPAGLLVEVSLDPKMKVVLSNGKGGQLSRKILDRYSFVRGRTTAENGTVDYVDGPYQFAGERLRIVESLKGCVFRGVPAPSMVVVKRRLSLPIVCVVLGLLNLGLLNTIKSREVLFYSLMSDYPSCRDNRKQAWRLLTYQFVHSSYFHASANWIVLLIFGAPVETTHGHALFLFLYEFGVFSGALVCGWADSYDSVIGSSGGTYAVFGAHAASIFKDWDRLKHGFLNRRTRLSIVLAVLATDFGAWYASKADNVSYAAHVGGGGSGFLLGILILRRRTARQTSAWIKRCKRPAFIVAFVVLAFFLVFSLAWYVNVFPPKPVSYAWYDHRGRRSYRPCCIQIFDCDLDPRDLEDSFYCTYDSNDDRYTLHNKRDHSAATTCSDLETL